MNVIVQQIQDNKTTKLRAIDIQNTSSQII
jgi:hypothetical protein